MWYPCSLHVVNRKFSISLMACQGALLACYPHLVDMLTIPWWPKHMQYYSPSYHLLAASHWLVASLTHAAIGWDSIHVTFSLRLTAWSDLISPKVPLLVVGRHQQGKQGLFCGVDMLKLWFYSSISKHKKYITFEWNRIINLLEDLREMKILILWWYISKPHISKLQNNEKQLYLQYAHSKTIFYRVKTNHFCFLPRSASHREYYVFNFSFRSLCKCMCVSGEYYAELVRMYLPTRWKTLANVCLSPNVHVTANNFYQFQGKILSFVKHPCSLMQIYVATNKSQYLWKYVG